MKELLDAIDQQSFQLLPLTERHLMAMESCRYMPIIRIRSIIN